MAASTCKGCFTERGTAKICPYCGFDESLASTSALDLPPETILNQRYRLGRVLGRGGFGITYLALDTRLSISVAVKECLPGTLVTRRAGDALVLMQDASAADTFLRVKQRFLDEARVLARFNQENGIVSVTDYFEENQTAYLVMQYVDGITLRTHLAQSGGVLPFVEALHLLLPVMASLDKVHQAGLIHRDISLDNLYLTTEQQVRLLDFGAVLAYDDMLDGAVSIMLKHGYAPPEQYGSRKDAQGPWTDVYALAATLYGMLTGHMPADAVERLQEDTLPLQHGLPSDVPEYAVQAILRALSLKPALRQPSMEAFRRDLMGGESLMKAFGADNPPPPFLSGETVRISPGDMRTSMRAAKKRRREQAMAGKPGRRRKYVVGSVLGLALLTVALLMRFTGIGARLLEGMGAAKVTAWQGFSEAESPMASPSSEAESPMASPSSEAESPTASPSSEVESPTASPSSEAEGPTASPSSATDFTYQPEGVALPLPALPDSGVMEVQDPALEKALRIAMYKPEGDLRIEEAKKFTSLSLTGLGIEDITPLRHFSNLRDIMLGQNRIMDISALAHMKDLGVIDLTDNRVTSIEPLRHLTGLTGLTLSDNRIGDIDPLSGLTSLTGLVLNGNPVSDLTPISTLTALEGLGLYGTQVTDLGPLSNLTALRDLGANGIPATDLSPISHLAQLETLSLGGSGYTSLEPIRALTGLTSLDLGYLQIDDISPLAGMTKLEALSMQNTRVTDISLLGTFIRLKKLYLGQSPISDMTPLYSIFPQLEEIDFQMTEVGTPLQLMGTR